MYYLGYEYKKELSIFVSRLTLKLQKEIKLYFFSEIETEVGKKKNGLQGFTITRYNISKEDALEMTKDLKCIHVNEKDTNSSETLFIIAQDNETVQAWYDMMRDGRISTILVREFNLGNGGPFDDDLISKMKKRKLELDNSMERCSAYPTSLIV
jgi:hypothetical protein